jgi:hypothetical protein
MTEYEQLLKDDFIRFFIPLMNKGTVKFDENGKLYQQHGLTKDTPWIFNIALSTDPRYIMKGCDIYHEIFSGGMNFIHSRCHECWKVVVNLKTVKQLFDMYELQQTVFKERPCKCGIDLRYYVPKLYGAYFYNKSLSKAKDCYSFVKTIVHSRISPDIDIFIKKGCTEFEIKFGRSDTWGILPHQERHEEHINQIFDDNFGLPVEYPAHLVAYVKRKWIHWASDHRDETVKGLTGGEFIPNNGEFGWQTKPYLYPNDMYVTYHEEEN